MFGGGFSQGGEERKKSCQSFRLFLRFASSIHFVNRDLSSFCDIFLASFSVFVDKANVVASVERDVLSQINLRNANKRKRGDGKCLRMERWLLCCAASANGNSNAVVGEFILIERKLKDRSREINIRFKLNCRCMLSRKFLCLQHSPSPPRHIARNAPRTKLRQWINVIKVFALSLPI